MGEICDGENGPRAPPGDDRGSSVAGRLRRVAVLLKSPNVMEGVLDGATTHQRCERGSHAPPLSMKDDGVSLAGARDLLGNKVKGDMMNDKDLRCSPRPRAASPPPSRMCTRHRPPPLASSAPSSRTSPR